MLYVEESTGLIAILTAAEWFQLANFLTVINWLVSDVQKLLDLVKSFSAHKNTLSDSEHSPPSSHPAEEVSAFAYFGAVSQNSKQAQVE